MKSNENGQVEEIPTVKRAAIIIIGDEIIKGQVTDTNSGYLAKELYGLGIKVGRISVIRDDLSDIATEVRSLSDNYDFVFTTGGIGPTHDDMTYVGIGQAFGIPSEIKPEMVTILDKWLSKKEYSRQVILKMAEMPISAKLIFEEGKDQSFPIVLIQNVYVFPGIPKHLQSMFPRLRQSLLRSSSGNKFYGRVLYVNREELSITPQLNVAVNKFKDSAIFGSYPVLDNLYYLTRITIESQMEENVIEAKEFLGNSLPNGSVVDLDPNPLETAQQRVYEIQNNQNHPLHRPVRIALSKVESAIDEFGLEKLAIAFNGGKDCTVLLHLFYAVVQKKFPHNPNPKKALSFRITNPFREMVEFARDTIDRYNLTMWTYDGPIQFGLGQAVKEHPEIRGVLLGTRRSDPSGSSLDYFQMTDPTWPQVMRINPLLDWSYSDVWKFLRMLTLPYCSLYDRGYTSLGSESNTLPNEALRIIENGQSHYRPAYTLTNSETERCGRHSSTSTT